MVTSFMTDSKQLHKDSPVLKLQDMAGSSSTPIEDVLSRAKMISKKLGLNDIAEWIEHELTGYPNDADLPAYRVYRGVSVYGHNPFNGWQPFELMNVLETNPEVYGLLTTMEFNNPISMIVEYSKSSKTLYADLPEPSAEYLRSISNCDFRISWPIVPAAMTRIISIVRSKVLDWALALESKGIYGEGLVFSQEEKKEAQNVTNNITNNNNNNSNLTINGDVTNTNGLIAGSASNVQQRNVTIGDFSTLESQLQGYGIDDADIQELKDVVEHSPQPQTKEEVSRGFGAWIVKMTGKAYTSGLKIASETVPGVLTAAICQYYGISV